MNINDGLELQRRLREREFDRLVREYLADGKAYPAQRQFQFGGPLNLISTIRKAFQDRAEATGCSDYEAVAAELAKVEAMADLSYDEQREAA